MKNKSGATLSNTSTRAARPPRPPRPRFFPDSVPVELRARRQWVNWRYTWNAKRWQWAKVPYRPTGGAASTTDRATWATWAQVLGAYQQTHNDYDGVGIICADGLGGLDVDHCLTDKGTLDGLALDTIATLNTYSEISPSGHGVRCLFFADALPKEGSKDSKLGLELYAYKTGGRYLTVTGDRLPNTSPTVEHRTREALELHTRFFSPPAKAPTRAPARPVLALDDAALLRKAQSAGQAFTALWNGDTSAHGSASEADYALCMMLAFWCAGDGARMDSLFRQSGLMREKWNEKRGAVTYGDLTIANALAKQTKFYNPKFYKAGDVPTGAPVGTNANTGAPVSPVGNAAHLTDMGNAERLASRHSGILKFVEAWGWCVWSGQRWERGASGAAARRAKETVRGIYAEAAQCANDEEREAVAMWALRSEGEGRINAMLNLAKSECEIEARPEHFDNAPLLLNCQNATLDLSTGQACAHNAAQRLTRMAGTLYDAAAPCPTWLNFLDRTFAGNRGLIDFVQRAAGYTLTGDTGEQVLFFCYGTGANGKSTFLETLRGVLGDYAQAAEFSTFLAQGEGVRNDIARMAGTRFIAAIEAGEGRRLNETIIKTLTGGDTVTARFLFKEYFEYKPQFKLWLAANHKPTIKGTDNAIWRRIRLIPFTVTIPEQERDGKLSQRLREEWPGILAWAARGARDWAEQGLGLPAEVRAATAAYRFEQDTLASFFDDVCTPNANGHAKAGDLYKAYQAWAEANGEKAENASRFGTRLAERGYIPGKLTGGVRAWRGLEIKAQ